MSRAYYSFEELSASQVKAICSAYGVRKRELKNYLEGDEGVVWIGTVDELFDGWVENGGARLCTNVKCSDFFGDDLTECIDNIEEVKKFINHHLNHEKWFEKAFSQKMYSYAYRKVGDLLYYSTIIDYI